MTSQFGDFCFICKGDFSWQMDFFTHVWAFWGEMQWTQETLAIMAFFEVGSAQMSLGANCLIDGIPARDIHSYLERDPKRDGVDDNNSGRNGRYHQRSHKYREMPGESGNKMRYGDTRWQTGLFLLCYCMSIHQMTRDLLFLTHRYKSEVLTSKFSSGTHWILKQNLWLDAFFHLLMIEMLLPPREMKNVFCLFSVSERVICAARPDKLDAHFRGQKSGDLFFKVRRCRVSERCVDPRAL